MDDFIAITKALSDPSRVRALMALRSGELCACQIIELLKLAPSTVSKHMSVLKSAGIIEHRKEERWMYYRLPDGKNEFAAIVRSTLNWILNALENNEVIEKDTKALSKIKMQNPSHLCKMQRGK